MPLVAIKGNSHKVVQALLGAGARVSPSTWISAMEQDFKPEYRAEHAKIIDLLLTAPCSIGAAVVLTAFDHSNFAG